MKWSDVIEKGLLELWHESEGKCQKSMISKRSQRKWVQEKLVKSGLVAGQELTEKL